MTLVLYCEVCHRRFGAQRNDAKYCSETCKQAAKYRRDNELPIGNLPNELDSIKFRLRALEFFINADDVDTQAKLSVMNDISDFRHIINKADAQLSVLEMQYNDAWFRCCNCGQKSFGRVDKCDFCGESNIERLGKVLP